MVCNVSCLAMQLFITVRNLTNRRYLRQASGWLAVSVSGRDRQHQGYQACLPIKVYWRAALRETDALAIATVGCYVAKPSSTLFGFKKYIYGSY